MLTPLTELVEADKPSSRTAHLGAVRLGAVAWVLLGLAIAVYLGPWLSNSIGVTLPAFAMVRTGRPNERLSLRGLADRLRKYL